jgi:hypothetical protein
MIDWMESQAYPYTEIYPNLLIGIGAEVNGKGSNAYKYVEEFIYLQLQDLTRELIALMWAETVDGEIDLSSVAQELVKKGVSGFPNDDEERSLQSSLHKHIATEICARADQAFLVWEKEYDS